MRNQPTSEVNWDKKFLLILPTYGNYGGPGYSAGKMGGTDFSVPAKNGLDAIFKRHDIAYDNAKSVAELYAKDTPIGVVLYARVDAEAAARLDAGAPTLRPQDWRSGESVRIVDLIAPFGGKEEMEREFGEMVK